MWQRIEDIKVRPIPRWVFMARKIGIWIALILSVVFGAFSLAYIVFAVREADMLTVVGTDPLSAVATLLPVWLLVFIIFIVLTVWGVEQTDRGYKIPLALWIVANLAVTSFGALALTALEAPAGMDSIVERNMEPLSVRGMSRPLWQMPQRGRIQGEIRTIAPELLTLQDPMGEEWEVILDEDTRLLTPVILEKRVGVMGQSRGEHKIEADVIVPLRRPLPVPHRVDLPPKP